MENRIVAVVTGANGGLGHAICQVLLRCLSLPTDQPIYETTPALSSIHPSLQHLYPSVESLSRPLAEKSKSGNDSPGKAACMTLTLVLVCRSEAKGRRTRDLLLKEHERLLQDRARKGMRIQEGWWDGLKIEIQTCDQSSLEGDNGVINFCERLKKTLPYITLLYLNAAHAQLLGNDYLALTKQVLSQGPIEAFTRPNFMREAAGVKTKDGQGGMVWSTNVLSGYVMCKELLSHLEASPASLPFEPRVIHTSSRTAELRALDANVLSDPQLIKAPKTYAASKYLATLMMVHFDRMSRTAGSSSEGQQSRSVRCVNVDPGSVRTNVMDEGFKAEGSGLAIYIAIMRWGYWLAFTFCKYVLGSTWHPGSPENASLAMVYASLLDPRYMPATKDCPGPVFQIWARRWLQPTVAIRDVDRLKEAEEVIASQSRECERVLDIARGSAQ